MKLIGVIAEFNPFHNGHAYLIEEARRIVSEKTGEDTYVVVCMSGNYVQRGSLAIIDKYARAKSALCSADIIFEMPVIWATSDAGRFAACGVDMLSRLSCDYLAFGFEAGNDAAAVSAELISAADTLCDEPEDYKTILAQYLSSGQAYPLARMNALKEYTGSDCRYISTSNNILALEYLISVKKSDSAIKPLFIPRQGAAYDCPEMCGNFSSATAIREKMTASGITNISDSIKASADLIESNMPSHSYTAIEKYLSAPAVEDSDILPYIVSRLKTSGRDELSQVYGMNGEILNRLMKVSYPTDYASLKDHMKTRNLTMTRICRLLLHTALDIKEPEDSFTGTEYANLLAMRRTASKVLEEISVKSDLTVINKKSAYKAESEASQISWSVDCRTTDIYNQIVFDKTGIILPSELRSNIVIL
ncbi:MAG: nucleotidyltransferase family protein [Eubacterium sp.]|nr:nucleotidyltransferase family protein [Eubacterium sp.]